MARLNQWQLDLQPSKILDDETIWGIYSRFLEGDEDTPAHELFNYAVFEDGERLYWKFGHLTFSTVKTATNVGIVSDFTNSFFTKTLPKLDRIVPGQRASYRNKNTIKGLLLYMNGDIPKAQIEGRIGTFRVRGEPDVLMSTLSPRRPPHQDSPRLRLERRGWENNRRNFIRGLHRYARGIDE